MWRALGSPEKLEILELGPAGIVRRDVLDWSGRNSRTFFAHCVTFSSKFGSIARANQNCAESLRGCGKPRYANRSAPGKKRLPVMKFPSSFSPMNFSTLCCRGTERAGILADRYTRGHFVETWSAPSSTELEFLDRYSVHPDQNERVEASLISQQTMDRIADASGAASSSPSTMATRGGATGGRHRGTVKAVRQHSVSADVYQAR